MDDGPNTDRQNQKRQANAGNPLPPAVAPLAPDADQPHGNNVEHESEENPEAPVNWFRNPDWWMVLLTAFLFLVGAVTLAVFYRQFKEMQTQTGILNAQAKQAAIDSIESAKKVETQLAISSKQADAADASVKAIRRQMRQDQRAWVEVRPVKEITQIALDARAPLAIPLKVTNVGKTMGLKVRIAADVEIVLKDQKPKLEFGGVGGTSGLIYKDMTFEVDAATHHFDQQTQHVEIAPLGWDEYAKLSTGEAYIVYFAKVEYRDIFNVKHWTHFCGWHAVVTGRYPASKCTAYNDADNN